MYTPGNVTVDETFTMSYRANTYTVRFDKNNQTATGSMSDQQMEYGTAKKLSELPKAESLGLSVSRQ